MKALFTALLIAAAPVFAESDTPASATPPEPYPLQTCLVSGEHLGGMGTPINYVYKREGKPDQLIRLCCRHCLSVFLGNPEKYLAKLEAAKRPTAPAPGDEKQPEGHAH